MKKVLISCAVAALAVAGRAFADAKTITKVAPDGANVITQNVDDNGNVVGESMTALGVVQTVEPTVQVYRVELHITDAGETAYLVGSDGVRRPIIVVSPDEYDLLTTRLDLMWQYFNNTREGRQKLHGKIVNTEIVADKNEKVEHHADGYTYVEKIPPRKSKEDLQKVFLKAKLERDQRVKREIKPPTTMSERQYEMRKRLAERRQHPVQELLVEHDANTGKEKVLSGGAE